MGFAGTKGFLGGFGRGVLTAFGEPEVKAFVQSSIDEALKLERALSLLRTEKRVIVVHYSPIVDTVKGEPVEIYPYLGNSRWQRWWTGTAANLGRPRPRPPWRGRWQNHGRHPGLQCRARYFAASEPDNALSSLRRLTERVARTSKQMGCYLRGGILPSFECHPERSEGSDAFPAPKYMDSSPPLRSDSE